MTTSRSLLFVHALTSLHPGTGTSVGTVDMPIQREKHTGWPTIAGSSMKGVLRDHCRSMPDDNVNSLRIQDVFGSEPADPEPQAGSLSITDARILAFPVRSAKGVFAWVTCPAVLQRFERDCAMVSSDGFPQRVFTATTPLGEGEVVRCSDNLVVIENGNNKISLEEFSYNVKVTPWQTPLNDFSKWVSTAGLDETTRSRFADHLVLIPDDEFGYFVQHATEVVARIGLESETKTVEDGALFYEEFLPPETLFYSVVIASKPRGSRGEGTADDVLGKIREVLQSDSMIQIGGNETIGKGFCSVRFSTR